MQLESLIQTCITQPKFKGDSINHEHSAEVTMIEEKESRIKKAIESYQEE